MPGALALLTAIALAPVSTGASASPAAGHVAPAVARSQEIALLLASHTARSEPSSSSRSLRVVAARRPLTGIRTALPVVGHHTSAGVAWLLVRLPGRPNGHTGWILRRATFRVVTRWHLVVDTSLRRLTVYDDGRVVKTASAVVGKPSTPTPEGHFFVEEAVALRPGDVGAPFALALSGRSEVFQEFDGGPGQIALHGLTNVGGVPGTAASHGCVRLDNGVMRWLAARIGSGVPVTITA